MLNYMSTYFVKYKETMSCNNHSVEISVYTTFEEIA